MLKSLMRRANFQRLALIGVLGMSWLPAANAAYTITLSESGGDVVASASGSINLTALTLNNNANLRAYVEPSAPAIVVGPAALTAATTYDGVAGPANFGAGAFLVANSGTGSIAGLDHSSVIVPNGYVSGSAISGTATWTGATLASLGITPGTYTWTWGTGPDADSLTLQVTAPITPPAGGVQGVPTLSEWAVIGLSGLLLAAAVVKRRRRN